MLPSRVSAIPPQSLIEAVKNQERALITNEVTKQEGNVARTTLHDKLKKYGLI